MIIKERSKSISHLILESLNKRSRLTSLEKTQYDNQVKGYSGEKAFDLKAAKTNLPGLMINDLLLSTRDTYYQIDSLLVTDDHIYLYEIKNYYGQYHYTNGTLHNETGYSLQNPVAQAERKRIYLQNLLISIGYRLDISNHVVFINPDFYIYDLPKIPGILFAGQLAKHFESIIESTPDQKKTNASLAKKLVRMHDLTYRPGNLPEYHYEKLKKGVFCPNCLSLSVKATRQTQICSVCGHKEKAVDAINRLVEELQLLFPERPLTKRLVYDWCDEAFTLYQIKTVLKENYRLYPAGRSSYYK
ncbi:nuclease-related domain-containing protein [Alkalibacterium kapii]|uniref:NERD domain-containing protein n=1 Tax=Alkalibacterium kapii TaxID=426704 RepID=A0A511AZF0_9LACT|nr:nuclease-related domain-containing protein [Alkalibacterium kapii]GEK90977.1 hypothetical protein AKA01nite_05990 [Alkalibacterium kapii]